MAKPLVIDLCCGLGGWTKGFLAEGWEAIGFDIEEHAYGNRRYPAELILKDITQVNGYDLRSVNPGLVVASPPCQRYSYMAMPWTRAKQQAAAIRADTTGQALRKLNCLFETCLRIASQAGVPIVLENVKGAQPWVGDARAHFGSFYLWGDVSAVGGRVIAGTPCFGGSLRPAKRSRKGRSNFHFFEQTGLLSPSFHGAAHESSVQRYKALTGQKAEGHVNIRDGFSHTRHLTNQAESDAVKGGGDWFSDPTNPFRYFKPETEGIKQHGSGEAWFDIGIAARSSQSSARKAASAMIAEIPFELACHVARAFKPA